MPDIVLTTLNAKYGHSSLALRYLMANLGELAPRAVVREYTTGLRAADVAEELITLGPTIIGFGVYIWNAHQTLELVKLIKQIRPTIKLILGGPEVSHESELQEIVRLSDFTICGESDRAFYELCRALLANDEVPRAPILRPAPPELETLASPYPLYTDEDIRHRSIYVEASRGCPFSCEFCLSSLDKKVRQFPLTPFLNDLEQLIERGAKHFKFIDRTFNLNIRTSKAILEFFLDRIDRGLFLHFEMVPDRLPDELREVITRFPAGSLQFEVGIQTFDPATAARISRRQNYDKLESNLRFLRRESPVHVHADLIAGLPGESLDQFAAGFDRLVELAPQEIQVGILKRLRGTPIVRHSEAHKMVFSPSPPYEILENDELSFELLQDLKRFARAWDLLGNSGNFIESKTLIWGQGSAFAGFFAFSKWLFAEVGSFQRISLERLCKLLRDYLLLQSVPVEIVESTIRRDYARAGRRNDSLFAAAKKAKRPTGAKATPKRQSRHLSNTAV